MDERDYREEQMPVWEAEPQTEAGYGAGGAQTPPPKKRRSKAWIGITLGCIVGVIALVGIYFGVEMTVNRLVAAAMGGEKEKVQVEKTEPVTLSTTNNKQSSDGIYLTDVSAIVENCMPSIVAITSQSVIEQGNYWWWNSGSSQQIVSGAGSGIIIAQTDTELLIATNNHVIESATSLKVQFVDDKSYDAFVKGSSSENDVAVIAIPLKSIDTDTLKAIKIATIGDSDNLKVGQGVIAIGNALGYGQSVTTGVVSALDREVKTDSYTKNMVQIDAAINGGNSGGALINAAGEVVGINSAKYSSSGSFTSASVEGMGFAIPVNDVKELIEEFMNQETLIKVDENKRGYLGIYGQSIDETTAKFWGAPQGVMVTDTVEGYAADKAGLQKGDIIVKLEGKKVTTMEELKDALSYYASGETVTVTISYQENRGYVEKDIEVTLSKAPKQ